VGANTELHAFIYAPNAAIDLTTAAPSNQEGALVAKSIKLGNQTYTYRTDYNQRSDPKLPGSGVSTQISVLDKAVSTQ
jgi:hypothetical protein